MCCGASLNVAYLFVDGVRLYTSCYERLCLTCVCTVSLLPCCYFVSTRKLPQRSCTLFPAVLPYFVSLRRIKCRYCCFHFSGFCVRHVVTACRLFQSMEMAHSVPTKVRENRSATSEVDVGGQGDTQRHIHKKTSIDTQTENFDILILLKRSRIKWFNCLVSWCEGMSFKIMFLYFIDFENVAGSCVSLYAFLFPLVRATFTAQLILLDCWSC
jgi:hypothetical protein